MNEKPKNETMKKIDLKKFSDPELRILQKRISEELTKRGSCIVPWTEEMKVEREEPEKLKNYFG